MSVEILHNHSIVFISQGISYFFLLSVSLHFKGVPVALWHAPTLKDVLHIFGGKLEFALNPRQSRRGVDLLNDGLGLVVSLAFDPSPWKQTEIAKQSGPH